MIGINFIAEAKREHELFEARMAIANCANVRARHCRVRVKSFKFWWFTNG